MSLHEEVMELLSAKYQKNIWDDVRSNPFYETGMLVAIHGRGMPIYGRVIEHKGFNERQAMHRYDVALIDSSIVERCFECDLEQIFGWHLRCIDGGKL